MLEQPNPKNLLTCVALSPSAPAVVTEALRIAAALGLAPVFVHIGKDEPAAREAVARTIRLAAGGQDVPADAVLFRTGHPARLICSLAATMGSEMIVMGALDRDPPFRRIWGSVARNVARNAPCSVMLLPGPDTRHPSTGRLVARINLDEESARMVPLALRLARCERDSLHFVHEFSVAEARYAVSDVRAAGEDVRSIEEFIYQRRKIEQRLLEEFLSDFDLGGCAVQKVSLAAMEGDEAVQYARRQQADLLIMPTPYRRLNFWDRFFHHPTELALRRLPCGLLLYRPPEGTV